MKNKFFNAISLAVIFTLLITSLALADGTPTIRSEYDDYAPGDSVNLFGSGWQPGESVHILVNDDFGSSWSRNVDVVADTNGTFTDTFVLPNWFVATYSVTATGVVSGTVTMSFTDGVTGVTVGSQNGTLTVGVSGSVTYDVLFEGSGHGAQTFIVSGLPSGATGAFNPSSGSDWPMYSTLTITTSNTTPAGTYTFTVQAGSKTGSGTLKIEIGDTTAPVISYTVNGVYPASPDGSNGWYKSNVILVWSVTDPESVVSKTGCVDQNITADQAEMTYSCSASSNGGSAGPVEVKIKRDATPPTISGSASPAANGAGWNNTDVTVSFTCGDILSGVASCSAPTTLGEGAGQSVTGTATDVAGNSADATVDNINVDETAPTVSATASPAANANGWNNTDVTVTFSGDDGTGSGIASCDSDVVLSSEGAGQSATGSCTDLAGNSASATASGINIDKTAPTASANASPAPNASGWNNTDVTVTFSGSDALSGVASCDAPVVLSSDGAGQSASGSCTDNAGNVSATATASGINIDQTAPTLSPSVSPNPVTLNGSATASPNASDATSGLASASCDPVDTSSIGAHSVNCTATDNAGNTNSVSASYSVVYDWNGFFQPVDNLPALNKAKAGSAIPVKFSLNGYQGLTIFLPGYPVSTVTTCGTTVTDTIESTVTAGSSSLSYDATADQYNYVWKTDKAWAGSCRTLTVKLIDGTTHQANFQFTK